MLAEEQLSAGRGIVRSADDRRRGKVIEDLLCRSRAAIDADLREEAGESHMEIGSKLDSEGAS